MESARNFATVLIFGPVALIGVMAFSFWMGLRRPRKIFWRWNVVGLIALVLVCGWLAFAASSGLGFFALIPGMCVTGTAIVAGILLAALLPGLHKLAAGVLVILFPAVLFLSIQVGTVYSPESLTQKQGEVIAQALERYRAENGTYPQTLEELVPEYLSDLREPQTVWGWLYTARDDEFSIGYVYWVDSLGYSVCVYSSSTLKWDCLPNSTGPFVLGPTPVPPRR